MVCLRFLDSYASHPGSSVLCESSPLPFASSIPNPHAYSNFFGVLNATTLSAASAALSSASAPGRPNCGGPSAPPPPRVSYTHYPLGVISSSPRPGMTGGGGRALSDVLLRYGVSAHLSGHLHSLAGSFMYAKREPSSSSALGIGSEHVLPEFEAGDWKENRRWRLLAFDGAGVTVADYDFKGGRVHSLEPSAVVSGVSGLFWTFNC